ncbi:hypothetical protein B484DRAFT_445691 [Ochromonadaceae sp. CCMP2298]|nr:hypothetical protein B484DRAFT_445691 [Ochromonadaceae sp. CCMP2298]|mmetsp:Transcript_24370/g.55135  ORF Transcript_24370/g.55135 Transcript_24370/m.55135 type:complete len:263 (-) Transcript_24370:189-977(-)
MYAGPRCFLSKGLPLKYRVVVQMGDVTSERGCAVVVSANRALCGSVNTSYWAFAGRHNVETVVWKLAGAALGAELQARKELREGVRAEDGDCVVTAAHNLRTHFRHILHTVPPLMAHAESEGGPRSAPLRRTLRSCYSQVLKRAFEVQALRVVLPALGCGVAGWSPYSSAQLFLQALGAGAGDVGDGHTDTVDCSSARTEPVQERELGPMRELWLERERELELVFCMRETRAYWGWVKALSATEHFTEQLQQEQQEQQQQQQ